MVILGATTHGFLRRKAHWAMCVALAVTACGGSQAPNPSASAQLDEMSLDSLRARITVLIGEPLASTVSQCRAIAFGSKPCGGPWSYLAYSTEVTDSVKLAQFVSLYNRRESDLNREEGRMSDCRAITLPGILLSRRRCALAP